MSASFTQSDRQARAIREIKDWFQNRTGEQQVFRVFGYAGSAKTTLTRHAIDELGLDTMDRGADGIVSGTGGVLYAAFTGKAALVMTRKGTPTSTIHSLIYRVSKATAAEIDRVEQKIDEIKAKLPTLDPAVRLLKESRLRSLEIRLDDIHKPRFVFNEQSLVIEYAAELAGSMPVNRASPPIAETLTKEQRAESAAREDRVHPGADGVARRCRGRSIPGRSWPAGLRHARPAVPFRSDLLGRAHRVSGAGRDRAQCRGRAHRHPPHLSGAGRLGKVDVPKSRMMLDSVAGGAVRLGQNRDGVLGLA